MNWYHRAEHRYVEYGSSLEATRAFGLFRTLYDTVYNMNMAHLSHEVETVFERLGDAGVRTACTPFLIYRGRRRHELGLEGLLRRVAVAAKFRHAVWGPDELFYGELYASRRVPCKPTLARPGTRDTYSACVGRELVQRGPLRLPALLASRQRPPHSHRYGVEAMLDSIAHADRSLGEIVDEAGGIDAFLDAHAVILMADHAQTDVDTALPLAQALGERLAGAGAQRRAAPPRPSLRSARRRGRRGSTCWLKMGGVRARTRECAPAFGASTASTWWPGSPVTTVPSPRRWSRARAASCAFDPAPQHSDRRGVGWDLEGEPAALALIRRDDGWLQDAVYPDGLARLWSALTSPNAGDLLVSLEEGYECVDWGGATHIGGASHGALLAGDSLGPARPLRPRSGGGGSPRAVGAA